MNRKKIAWLPSELRGYNEGARKLLGVLVPKDEKVTGENYHLYYRNKVLSLVRKRNEDPYLVLDNLLPRGFEREKESSQDLVERMYQDEDWMRPKSLMVLYLRKELPLKKLEQALDMKREPELYDLKRELESLTLREFLELAVV